MMQHRVFWQIKYPVKHTRKKKEPKNKGYAKRRNRSTAGNHHKERDKGNPCQEGEMISGKGRTQQNSADNRGC